MNATARTLDGLVDDFMVRRSCICMEIYFILYKQADVRPEAVLCVPGSGEGLNTRLEVSRLMCYLMFLKLIMITIGYRSCC